MRDVDSTPAKNRNTVIPSGAYACFLQARWFLRLFRAESREDAKPLPDAPSSTPEPASGQQLAVNWMYGAYIPKEAPLEALSGADRLRL